MIDFCLAGDRAPWITLVALLGVPTKDGRMLAADGKFTMAAAGPLLVRKPPEPGSAVGEQTAVGAVAGLLVEGGRLYALGVADDLLAEQINSGTVTLGVDLMATDYESTVVDGHPRLTLKDAQVRAAYLQDSTEEFAWS